MIRHFLIPSLAVLTGGVAFAHPPAPIYAPPVAVYAPPFHGHRAGFAPAPIPVYTLDNFAREFRPSEGHHKVLIVHPVTCRPVEVCFTLPCGKLEELDVNRRSIKFDFGRREVRIDFRRNGTVDVRAD